MPISLRAFLTAAVAVAAAIVAVAPAGVELEEDPPVASPPAKGALVGRITPATRVAALSAVSRTTGKTYRPTTFDPKTGAFAFRDLPGDASYDVRIRCADGRTIEGIDLEFTDARLLRLAARRRKQLAMPPERPGKFTRSDADELLKFVRNMKDFMEINRVLCIRGHGARATMLLELMRTRKFYSSGGTVIWRVELWYFENQHGGWTKLPNQERVLRRERLTPAQWRKIGVEYYPELSGYVDPQGKSKPIRFAIPAKPDPSRGRPAGTEPKLKTRPLILGLEDKPAPATRPAATRPATRPADRER